MAAVYRRRALHLRSADVSSRLSRAGFTRHTQGVAGFDVSDGVYGVEVYNYDADGEIRNPSPRMQAWGRHLVAQGFCVVVVDRLYLLVTMPTVGGAQAASHAVERAA